MSEEENVLRDRRAAWPETRWRGDREASHLLGPRHLHLQNGGLDRVPAGAPPPTRGSLGDDDLHDQTWELREAGAGLGPGSRACRPRDALPGSPSWGPRPGVPVLSAPLRGADGGRRLRQSRRLFGFPVASALSGRAAAHAVGPLPLPPLPVPPGVSLAGRAGLPGEGHLLHSAHRVKSRAHLCGATLTLMDTPGFSASPSLWEPGGLVKVTHEISLRARGQEPGCLVPRQRDTSRTQPRRWPWDSQRWAVGPPARSQCPRPELGARTEAGGGGAAGRAGCRGRQPRARLSGRFPLRRSKRSTGGGGSGGSRGFTRSSASPPALSSPRERTPERVHLAAAPQAAGGQDRLPFLAVRRQRPAEEPRFLPQETRWLNRCVRARAPWGRGARPVSEGDASVDAPASLRRPPGGRGFPRERPPCVPPSFFDFVSE